MNTLCLSYFHPQVILAKRRDDEENRAGLLAWQCSFKRDDLVWEGDVPRLTAPLEASLREALDL